MSTTKFDGKAKEKAEKLVAAQSVWDNKVLDQANKFVAEVKEFDKLITQLQHARLARTHLLRAVPMKSAFDRYVAEKKTAGDVELEKNEIPADMVAGETKPAKKNGKKK